MVSRCTRHRAISQPQPTHRPDAKQLVHWLATHMASAETVPTSSHCCIVVISTVPRPTAKNFTPNETETTRIRVITHRLVHGPSGAERPLGVVVQPIPHGAAPVPERLERPHGSLLGRHPWLCFRALLNVVFLGEWSVSHSVAELSSSCFISFRIGITIKQPAAQRWHLLVGLQSTGRDDDVSLV